MTDGPRCLESFPDKSGFNKGCRRPRGHEGQHIGWSEAEDMPIDRDSIVTWPLYVRCPKCSGRGLVLKEKS